MSAGAHRKMDGPMNIDLTPILQRRLPLSKLSYFEWWEQIVPLSSFMSLHVLISFFFFITQQSTVQAVAGQLASQHCKGSPCVLLQQNTVCIPPHCVLRCFAHFSNFTLPRVAPHSLSPRSFVSPHMDAHMHALRQTLAPSPWWPSHRLFSSDDVKDVPHIAFCSPH